MTTVFRYADHGRQRGISWPDHGGIANPYNNPRDVTFIGGHRGDHTEPSGVR